MLCAHCEQPGTSGLLTAVPDQESRARNFPTEAPREAQGRGAASAQPILLPSKLLRGGRGENVIKKTCRFYFYITFPPLWFSTAADHFCSPCPLAPCCSTFPLAHLNCNPHPKPRGVRVMDTGAAWVAHAYSLTSTAPCCTQKQLIPLAAMQDSAGFSGFQVSSCMPVTPGYLNRSINCTYD